MCFDQTYCTKNDELVNLITSLKDLTFYNPTNLNKEDNKFE